MIYLPKKGQRWQSSPDNIVRITSVSRGMVFYTTSTGVGGTELMYFLNNFSRVKPVKHAANTQNKKTQH